MPLTQVLTHSFFGTEHPVVSLSDVVVGCGLDKENRRPPLHVSGKKTAVKPVEFRIEHFTTKRLKPLSQTIKYGRIELLESGKVLVDFHNDQHVLVINHNGTTLDLYRRNTKSDYKERTPDYSCTIGQTPKQVQRTVTYAAKFVDLVRSKTPKVIPMD